MRLSRWSVPIVIVTVVLGGCGTPSREARAIAAELTTDSRGATVVSVTGWSSAELRDLRQLADDAMLGVVRVSVEHASAPILGSHAISDDAVIFTPQFPFDPGRRYVVRVDPSRLPSARAGAAAVDIPVALPSRETARARVVRIAPSAAAWPENILRFYLYFSGPMSRESTTGRVTLRDESGQEIRDALLEYDVDLWNDERTRLTVFFDPGRVKQGIRPNLELGRALVTGRRYAIDVDASMTDAEGRPLSVGFSHVFHATSPIERPLDLQQWSITTPSSGSRDTLDVTFPWALDDALLKRVVQVRTPDGRAVDGDVAVDLHQTRWRFTPREPWTRGAYSLVAESVLEDPSGNRIGRAFDVAAPAASQAAAPERFTRLFVVK